jgi:hypothetical protein
LHLEMSLSFFLFLCGVCLEQSPNCCCKGMIKSIEKFVEVAKKSLGERKNERL